MDCKHIHKISDGPSKKEKLSFPFSHFFSFYIFFLFLYIFSFFMFFMNFRWTVWDLTSVLYAVEGSEKFSPAAGKFSHVDEKFVKSPSGRVCIDDFGMSSFIGDSKSLQTVLKVAPADRQAVLDRLVELTVRR